MTTFRKLRAIAGMALTWGLAWVPLSLVSITALTLLSGRWPGPALLGAAAAAGLLAGAVSGTLFGTLLASTAHERTVARLSARRMAALGVFSGMVPAGLMAVGAALQFPDGGQAIALILARVVGITAILGAASAGALLWTVRRAPPLPREVPIRELANGPAGAA